ncbi:MAG: YbaB/EbfC family nucleoid-associated protein [Deltaproteobacteria bacterium]|jgi:DNA-binding YbaB/EbfC family protein|nr:YbaB/EbfC family nucleoid-associated protein [Deltaproteobacteria bacterium]
MFGMDIMRQAQEMQSKIEALQEELAKRTVTASSGGGMVTVSANGRQELTAVSIERAVAEAADAAMLEDLVLTAVNEALRRSRAMMAEEMRAVTGGFSIPGLS